MRVDIVTIFPEYFAPLDLSLIGRARAAGILDIAVHDLRTWTHDVHRTVDDTPYGGGPGMVMRPEPWGEALDALLPPSSTADQGQMVADQRSDHSHSPLIGGVERGGVERGGQSQARLVVPTPAGTRFTQRMAHEFADQPRLIFACGRYEGIDQRVLDHAATRIPVSEVSLGDYVLFGGEVAVLVILEAVTRLLPGVLGNVESLAEESHAHGLLEAPVYTKPAVWRGHEVPEVLRSGDHGRIARWRRDQALSRTATRRPDLLTDLPERTLDEHDIAVLAGTGFRIPGTDMAE
jgi:tRNA (guanine37-N1)-methyltransferase